MRGPLGPYVLSETHHRDCRTMSEDMPSKDSGRTSGARERSPKVHKAEKNRNLSKIYIKY